MVNFTKFPAKCAPSVNLTTSTDGVAVVKAAFGSCIGVDIHHSILVCAFQYCDIEKDQIRTELREFGTGAAQLAAFADWCRACCPERVVMESTGVLWVSPYQALEDVGFTKKELALINARDFKAITGRKTDKQDAQRLAEYGRLGKISSSFVPERRFREQRMIARQYSNLIKELARNKARYIKVFNFVGCRISNAFSDINGKAARAIVKAYLTEKADLVEIIGQHGKRLRRDPEEIAEALRFVISDPLREELLLIRQHLDFLESAIAAQFELLRKMQSQDQPLLDILMGIPGLKEAAARLILAEISDDLTSFPNAEHFSSWCGVCPGNNESAGKRRYGHAAKGNRHLRAVLIECAQAIGLSKNNPLRERFQAFKERRGHRRAVLATAHILLKLIYSLIRHRTAYQAVPTNALRKVRLRRYQTSVRNVKQLKYSILEHGVLCHKTKGAIVALSP